MEDNVLHVELEYPNVEGNKDTIEINMTSVRADDGLRLKYDFNRNGWAIYKPQATHPYESERSYGYHEEWVEVAYIPSWMFDTYFIEKDGTKILKED